MTEPKKSEEETSENIFRIADELVYQVDRTKKFVVIMIVAIIVAIPVSWHVAPIFLGTPYNFRLAEAIAIVIALVFLLVGVRQWLVLSKWTRRYKTYKELQKKIDEKLDFEGSEENGKDS